MDRLDPASRDPFLDRSTAPEPHATWNRPDEEEIEDDEDEDDDEGEDTPVDDRDMTDEDEEDASKYDLDRALDHAEVVDYGSDEPGP